MFVQSLNVIGNFTHKHTPLTRTDTDYVLLAIPKSPNTKKWLTLLGTHSINKSWPKMTLNYVFDEMSVFLSLFRLDRFILVGCALLLLNKREILVNVNFTCTPNCQFLLITREFFFRCDRCGRWRQWYRRQIQSLWKCIFFHSPHFPLRSYNNKKTQSVPDLLILVLYFFYFKIVLRDLLTWFSVLFLLVFASRFNSNGFFVSGST